MNLPRSARHLLIGLALARTATTAAATPVDDLRATLRRAGDAELAALPEPKPIGWEAGVFYAGLSAYDLAAGDDRDTAALRRVADQHHWTPATRKDPYFADDVCVCQTFLDLYDRSHDPADLRPTRQAMDRLVAHLAATAGAKLPTWWWCDALFMAPAVMVHLSADTGDRQYLNAMTDQWWRVSALLYDPKAHLYYRDDRFVPPADTAIPPIPPGPATRKSKRVAERPVFWSRGNGWVVAGLARVLSYMPADYPARPRFVAQYREMAARLADLQPADGLWPTDLLAAPKPGGADTSGTGLDVYALAWGINHGLLDRGRYLPVVARGWAALRRSVLPDGRIGYTQAAGYKPAPVKADGTTPFGNGAFLLAGSELLPLADALPPPPTRR